MIKIAIVMATYMRDDNSSKQNILRVFDFLQKQTYTNFTLFLIGDTYKDNIEFEELCKLYKGNIYYYNSEINYRTDYFTNKFNKWSVGGVNAMYLGVKKAILESYDLYFHLDDDDIWTENHIQRYIDIYKNYPLVDFITCKSIYCNKSILPNEHNFINKISYNNIIVRHSNLVHSSWCFNLKTMSSFLEEIFNYYFNIINNIKNKIIEEYPIEPFDSQSLKELHKLQINNKIRCICDIYITCIKYDEGSIIN